MQPRTVLPSEWQAQLTSFEEAQARVLSSVATLPAVYVALDDAIGMVSAENVVSQAHVPPFANASMDGYAVAAGKIGQGTSSAVDAVAHISTGMPLPVNTDAVVPWEHTTSQGGQIVFDEPVHPGQFVRARGHDISLGDIVVPALTKLGPVHLGVLASIGQRDVLVHRRPRVGVLVSGEELAAPGSTLEAGSLFDVNSTLLPALLRSAGATVSQVLRVIDDREKISKGLRQLAAESDLIVTTGGASVGERDWVRTVVQDEGEIALWRVAVRPGKPFAAGQVFETPVLLLPGNPGSVLACTHGFVAPMVRRMQARSGVADIVAAQLCEEIVNDQERTFLCPVNLQQGKATPLLGPNSQALQHAAAVDGFVIAPPRSIADAGSTVMVELMA